MSSIRFRWRALSAPLAVFLLVLMSVVPTMSLAQTSTVPTGHAQVIAQGVDLMPRVPVAWRMTESRAAPADEAEFFARTLGFTIGTDDPILVTDGNSDALTLLHDGQASFHPEGASERRSSTTNSSTDYVNIELIVSSWAAHAHVTRGEIQDPIHVAVVKLVMKCLDYRNRVEMTHGSFPCVETHLSFRQGWYTVGPMRGRCAAIS